MSQQATMKNLKLTHYFLIAIGVIFIDQVVKYLIHQNMYEGESITLLGDWFKINYVTNPGMAFGITLGGAYGKVILTVFRLGAMFGIAWYIKSLIDKKAHAGFILCIAFILGGAVGNLVDSVIYAILDTDLLVSPYDLGGTPAPFALFHGKVIDMFYLDIISGYYPEWLPGMGGDYYSFWPVFNVADAAIFCSVIVILVKQKVFFVEEEPEVNQLTVEEKKEEETV
jgi:signal peptidase II